ncbi:MAG TPA: HAD family phosphatase, partial [Woeseiaceae bacterium]|nr:HAD family phosphatase [Woeseiaceae bacterium]
MRIDAVVFDMDGLMLDTEPLYKTAWQGALAELGHELDDAAYLRFVGRSTEDCENDLVSQLGEAFPLEAFRDRWPVLWRTCADEQGIAAKAGLHELIAFVRDEGLQLALATSSDSWFTELSLGCANLLGLFDVVVTGNQVTHPKPAPDIYIEAARRLAVNPRHCVALEDSEAGILAASRAGMVPLLVPDLRKPTEEAIEAAFRVLGSLHEARELLIEQMHNS